MEKLEKVATVTVTEALVLRPTTRRRRAHITANPYPAARKQNQTEMCSDRDETITLPVVPPVVLSFNEDCSANQCCTSLYQVSTESGTAIWLGY